MEIYNVKEGIGAQHFPVPHGGLKLLLSAFLVMAVAFFFASIIPLWISFVLSLMVCLLVWPAIAGVSFSRWVRDYWLRNVRGCLAVFSYSKDSPHTDEAVPIMVDIRAGRGLRMGFSAPCVIVPLGGWSKEARIYPVGYSHRWWVVRYKFWKYGAITLQIRDDFNDRVTFRIEELLHVMRTPYYGNGMQSLGETFYGLHTENGVLNRTLVRERQRSDTRAHVVVEAIESLAASRTRFGRCKEAKGIKCALAKGLLQTVPSDEVLQRSFLRTHLPSEETVAAT